MKSKFIPSALFCLLLSAAPRPFLHAQTYTDYLQAADKALQADSLEQAVEYYKKALRMGPSDLRNAMVFANMGTLYRRMGHDEKALEAYDLSLAAAPYEVQVLLDRAALLLTMNRYRGARIDYDNVIDIDPDNIEAHLYRAYLEVQQRDYKGALADYRMVLEHEPNHRQAVMGAAFVYEKTNRPRQGLDLINNYLQQHPDDEEALHWRANAEVLTGQYEAALFDYDQLIDRDPRRAELYVAKGEVLKLLNRNAEARKIFDQAVRLGYPRKMLKMKKTK